MTEKESETEKKRNGIKWGKNRYRGSGKKWRKKRSENRRKRGRRRERERESVGLLPS